MRQFRRVSQIFFVTTLAFAFFAAQASAGTYPSYDCASEKMEAAAARCDQVLKAWSIWTQNQNDPQSRIDQADAAFDARWASAEDAASMANVDCADMTLPAEDMKALMDMAIDDIVMEVTDGLDLGAKKEAICGSKILKSAATMCMKLLRAESRYIGDLSAGPGWREARRGAGEGQQSVWPPVGPDHSEAVSHRSDEGGDSG